MNEQSRSEQAQVPGQAAAEAQDKGRQYGGGDAVLDAEIEASQNQPDDEALDEPTATDITGNTNDEPKNV